MTERNLIALPLGDYELTDGIYYYEMNKSLTKGENPVPIYTIQRKGDTWNGARVTLFEDRFDVYDHEDCLYYMRGKFFRKGLSSVSGVGGISIHSKDTYRAIRDLRFENMPYIYNRIPKKNP